jgi:hypothetical protein
MNKFKTILTAGLAAALLTLSCAPAEDEDVDDNNSSNNGGSSGSNSGSGGETYNLIEQEDEFFSYFVPYEYDYCEEGGVLKTVKDSSERTQYYSIDNKVMTWGDEYDYMYGDTLIFKGSSNELKGTWTRTRNKDASCHYEAGGYEPGMVCKYDYDITKAVFTDSKVTITRDECITDRYIEEDRGNGWQDRVVNCSTVEIYKGSDKVTLKITKTTNEMSYNGKPPCKLTDPTKAQKQTACKNAWDEYKDNDEYGYQYGYYTNLEALEEPYYECLVDMLPEDLLDDGDYPPPYDICDYYPDYCEEGKIAAKSVAKAKAAKIANFKPLLKKKK